MGRQIHFHLLPEDRDAFLGFVQEHDPVTIVLRDADSAELECVTDLNIAGGKTLCLWNRKLLAQLERKWIPAPAYYRVDGLWTPTLEFMESFSTTWEGKPALGQGRLFGDFDLYLGKPPEFAKWYDTLVRWIRKHWKKNPAGSTGYVGPAAFEFYEKGGYLLPQFLPPKTKAWLTEIGKQHSSDTRLLPRKAGRRKG
jgi:hypothetical protein